MASLSTGLPSMCHQPCMLESMYHRVSASSGFPVVYNMASGMGRFPCIFKCIYHGPTRIVGLPCSIQYDLRHGPASMYLTVYLSSGLPHCRASLIHTIGPPA